MYWCAGFFEKGNGNGGGVINGFLVGHGHKVSAGVFVMPPYGESKSSV